jgi:hypothetical protein
MAAPALFGGGAVNRVLHSDFQVWWLVAIHASYSAVSTGKEERSGRVIEA